MHSMKNWYRPALWLKSECSSFEDLKPASSYIRLSRDELANVQSASIEAQIFVQAVTIMKHKLMFFVVLLVAFPTFTFSQMEPECVDSLLYLSFDLGLFRYVHCDGKRIPAVGLNVLNDRIEAIVTPRFQNDRCAQLREVGSSTFSETAARAGDHDDFSFKNSGSCLSPFGAKSDDSR
jgi:hypothetical protein